jgi:DNA-binding NarL/FixJ family response regulator
MDRKKDSRLTTAARVLERDTQIMELLIAGKSNGEIANATGVSKGAIKQRLQRLYALAKVGTRLELAVWWTKENRRFRNGRR